MEKLFETKKNKKLLVELLVFDTQHTTLYTMPHLIPTYPSS
jgi:hypothetical protein